MRSTSGTTCCHFFCSAVFSMPVCRYPMVGMHDLIVSPSSSSTRRSTPCVLGCCGPMLTVIVSVRSSGIVADPLTKIATKARRHEELFLQEGLLRAFVSSWQTSLERSLHQIAHHVQQRAVHFLHARRRLARHVDVNR